VFRPLLVAIFIFLSALIAHAQSVAVFSPDGDQQGERFAEMFSRRLQMAGLKVLDGAMARAAFNSFDFPAPYNLSTDEAKRAALAIGCEYFLLIRSAVQRRSAFKRSDYYESYAAIFSVSGRTGRLIDWRIVSKEDPDRGRSLQMLDDSVASTAELHSQLIRSARPRELAEVSVAINEMPDPDSAAAKGLRAPVPYKRIKPTYTDLANLYGVTGTIEAVVDLDANGNITRLEISRWAGFGLDQSVESAVRSMNWRPAERNGQFLPMRFSLRYNFKKLEKDH
jgi:TonB family protein